MEKRPYRLKRRAAKQVQTRERIVEATVALHSEIGFRDATISAIAERAGVQRLTVYRHFPDDASLFAACSAHWMTRHPPPDPTGWTEIADPVRRRETALQALYGYYRETAPVWRASYRDQGEVPALRAAMSRFEAYLSEVAEGLLAGRSGEPSASFAATLRHALQFSTWDELTGQGLSWTEAAELVSQWLDCLR